MRHTSFLMTFALLCGMASTAVAGSDALYAYLKGDYDGSAVQIEIRIFRDEYRGDGVALDVYRSALGLLGCGPEIRITDHPIPCPSAFPTSVTLTDASVTPGTGYKYDVRVVDAQRNPVGWSLPIGGFATTGVALISHGMLFFDPFGGIGYGLQICEAGCLADGHLLHPPDELLQYVDTDTRLLLYGEVVGVGYAPQAWLATLRIDHGRPSSCVVDVAPATWGSAKRLYR